MFAKLLTKIGLFFAFCALLTFVSCAFLTDTSTGTAADSDCQHPNCVSEYKELYDILELSEDATDSEIIQLLDMPNKRIIATTLIRHKRISSATPKLLQIVNDVNENNAIIMYKIAAAEALCDFGNREWMPTIKTLSIDPNGMISRTSYKFKVAGLLARAGDYSQFEILNNGLTDSRDYIRSTSVHQLRNFGHKTDPVTDSAVKLLTSVAMSDPVPRMREYAIESLEKIAKIKPEVTLKVIDVLKANMDSPDKNLSIICRVKLKMYGQELRRD